MTRNVNLKRGIRNLLLRLTSSGFVARYTDIAAGDGGDMRITVSGNKIYLSAMMFEAAGKPD